MKLENCSTVPVPRRSDVLLNGCERDDPALLGQHVQRLHWLAHRVVWNNPRKGAPASLASGMAVPLPLVGDLVEGHSLAAFHGLVRVLLGHRVGETLRSLRRPRASR